MKLTLLSFLTVLGVALGGVWLAGNARPEDPVVVDYTFRAPPIHSVGAKSLSDLRGTPIVIDFWGKN